MKKLLIFSLLPIVILFAACKSPADISSSPQADSNEDPFCEVYGDPTEKPSESDPDADGEIEAPTEIEEFCFACGNKDCDGRCEEDGETDGTYAIDLVTINGKSIRDYVITSDLGNSALASLIQSFLYEKTGSLLEILPLSETPQKNYVSIRSAKRSGGDGFYITKSSDDLIITSEFPNKSVFAGEKYLKELFENKEGTIELREASLNVRDVFYKDFGAVGDGKTNDYEAIKKAHDYANEYGHTVVAQAGATYYLKQVTQTITVKTNTDFSNATFIIDGAELSSKSGSVFTVSPDFSETTFGSGSPEINDINDRGVFAYTDKIDLGLGFPALLIVEGSPAASDIRHDSSEGERATLKDILSVDEYGNLSKGTPPLFNLSDVTEIRVIRTDEEPVTLSGGRFITRTNLGENGFEYYGRIIAVNRSNTTVSGIIHEIEDEARKSYGDPYSEFISVSYSNNTLIKNCFFTAPRVRYHCTEADGNELKNASAIIRVSFSNGIRLDSCKQTDFFDSSYVKPNNERSAVMSFSYTKNVICAFSVFSVFEAQNGIYNAEITDSALLGLKITGGGNVSVERCRVYGDVLIDITKEYGSTWKGNVILKDVTLQADGEATLLFAYWLNHDFGYRTYMPENIIVDNLTLINGDTVNIFAKSFVERSESILADEVDGEANVNKTQPPAKIVIRNNISKINFILPTSDFFKDTEFIFED